MNYIEAKEYKHKLESIVETYSERLQGFKKNNLGMIPNEIRETEEYKEAKLDFDKFFNQLQEFNKYFMKQFKKEYSKERAERRRARA